MTRWSKEDLHLVPSSPGDIRRPMQGNQPYMHPSQGSPWVIYIVRCRDGSYYTGITTDLQRRIEEHNSRETGAKYTRSRRPVILVYSESAPSRAVATQRENQIKKMNIADKKQVIAAGMPVKPIFTAKS